MKRPKLEFNQDTFYLVGKYVFFTSGLIGIIRILDLWNTFKSYEVVSSLDTTIFKFALWILFCHLGKKKPVELDDGDVFKMNDALEKLNLEEPNVLEKKNGKKRH
jgi:hypothetical protein